jgi:glycerophosphoryl diester phosphodiesterase
MGSVDWLTAQPVAHRGLHDASAGVIENTAAAFSAAMAAGYSIETDLQISATARPWCITMMRSAG